MSGETADYRPWVPPRDRDAAVPGEAGSLEPRPVPPGMSRRDRRLWRVLEAERVAEQVNAARGYDDFRAGFAHQPPKAVRQALGRSGRRAFRAADRAARAKWWAQRRRIDVDSRAVGALVVVLALGVFILIRLATRDATGGQPAAAPQPANPAAPTSTTATSRPPAPAPPVTAAEPSTTAAATSSAAPPSRTGPATAGEQVFGNGGATATPTATAVGVLPAGVLAVSTASTTPATFPPAPAGPISDQVRGDPVATAKAWFQRVCGSSWTEPFGAGAAAVRSVMSPEGWAYAEPARDAAGQRWWSQVVVPGQETRHCIDITAARYAGPGPATATTVLVQVQARRWVVSQIPGRLAEVEQVTEVRRMTKGQDGRWLVGPVPAAG